MANYKSGAQRYNDRMDKIMENARRIERERLEGGHEPNPSLTSPEEGRKYGWEIKGREVRKVSHERHESKVKERKEHVARRMGHVKK